MSINKKKVDERIFYLTFIFVLALFSSVFLLSLFKIVNSWTFSQAHVNYFDGYVKRGLFGTLMLLIEEITGFSTRKFFSFFFIILTTANILLFFLLIKKFSRNYLLFFFLALNPTLILFQFNDLGGYQRFDSLSIFLILLHSLISYNVNIEKVDLKFYKKILYLIIFPVFIFSLFVHEIIAFSIFFHIFLTFKTIKKKRLLNITPYFFLFGLILFILIFPENNLALEKLNKLAHDRGLFLEAMIYASSFSSVNSHIAEFNQNFFILYNAKIHFFFIFIATILLTIIPIYLKNKKYLVFSKSDFIISFTLIAPYLIFFAIGDSGRWISLISFTSLGIFCQYEISKKFYNPSFANYNLKKKIIYTIISITIFVLCFFIRLPHCCNLEEKKITIWGGISSKILILSKILKKDKNDFYDLDKRFKN
jgi:hypothetical protein